MTYHAGFEVELTGNKSTVAGATFLEFVYIEGHKKGQTGSMRDPSEKDAEVAAKRAESATASKLFFEVNREARKLGI